MKKGYIISETDKASSLTVYEYWNFCLIEKVCILFNDKWIGSNNAGGAKVGFVEQ